jgi:hypothetical protein
MNEGVVRMSPMRAQTTLMMIEVAHDIHAHPQACFLHILPRWRALLNSSTGLSGLDGDDAFHKPSPATRRLTRIAL